MLKVYGLGFGYEGEIEKQLEAALPFWLGVKGLRGASSQ